MPHHACCLLACSCRGRCALAVVGDFLLPALRWLAGSICPSRTTRIRRAKRQAGQEGEAGQAVASGVTDRLAQWNPCGLQRRSVRAPPACFASLVKYFVNYNIQQRLTDEAGLHQAFSGMQLFAGDIAYLSL